MNALRVLMAQHDRVEALLAQVRATAASGEEARREAVARFADELHRHFEAEEALFYPAVEPRLILVKGGSFSAQHGALKVQLERLQVSIPGDAGDFERAAKALHEELVRHVSDEEIELFPEVKRRFEVDELDELGRRMEELRARSVGPEPEPEPEAAGAERHGDREDEELAAVEHPAQE